MTRVFIVARSSGTRAALRDRCVAAGLTVVGESAEWSNVPAAGVAVIVVSDEEDITAVDAGVDSVMPPMLLLSDRRSSVRRLLSTGVQGWGVVPTTIRGDELAAAANAVAHGLAVAPASFMVQAIPGVSVASTFSSSEGALVGHDGLDPGATEDAETAYLQEALTVREREVLELAGQGHSNRAIAEGLGISEHTVKFHLASIYGKLGVSTRTAAVRRGLRRGLITI